MSTSITYNQFSEITSIQETSAGGIVLSSQTFSYDANGNLLSSTNANGNTTNYTVNALGLPTGRTDPNGNNYTYQYNSSNEMVQESEPATDPTWTYDSAGDMTSYTDANGATTTYSYDLMGRVVQKTLPINGTTSATYSFTYDAAGNLASKTIPLYYSGSTLVTATSTYTYNGLNEVVTATDPLGNVTNYSYDPNGNLVGVTDPLGNTTKYGYDADNRRVSRSVPVSGSGTSQVYATTTDTLDASGNVTSVTDPLGNTTQYTYNARGWLMATTDPLGNQVVYAYYDTGDIKTKTLESVSGAAQTWNYVYDQGHNVTSVTDPMGSVTFYSYDANGNLLSEAGASNFSYTYDALNRLASVTDGAGDTTTYGYDAVGNRTQMTDPLGNVTTYSYDDQGRLLTTADPLTGTTSLTYNLAGRQTSETDPVGNTTSYAYNAAGWLVGETNPLGYSSSYVYNAAGEETGYTDYVGNQTQYAYNEAGWQTGETWLNSLGAAIYQANYTYDLDGHVTAASDPNSSYSYVYDADSEMTQQTVTYPGLSSAPLVTLGYGYDGMGARASLTDSLGGEVDTTFIAGQLTQLSATVPGATGSISVSIDYANDLPSDATLTTPSATIVARYGYDPAGRVTSIAYNGLVSFTYAYNAASQVTGYAGPEGTINYNYDNTGQLTSVSGDETAGYSYDVNGNRTMTGYATGAGNQLLSDNTFTYTYNKNGQLATKTDGSGNAWTYSWDHRGRLIEVVETNSADSVVMDEHLVYDVNDNLIGTILNSTPQMWTVWDGKNPYLQFDGSGNLAERYLTNPAALNQFFAQVGAGGSVEWLLADRLGSVRLIADGSGNVLDRINYDAYGNIASQSSAAVVSAYLFQGGYLDINTGLERFGARWYDPGSGRWISEDPLGFKAHDSDLYRFVGNHATEASDPTGLEERAGGRWQINPDPPSRAGLVTGTYPERIWVPDGNPLIRGLPVSPPVGVPGPDSSLTGPPARIPPRAPLDERPQLGLPMSERERQDRIAEWYDQRWGVIIAGPKGFIIPGPGGSEIDIGIGWKVLESCKVLKGGSSQGGHPFPMPIDLGGR